MGIIFRPHAGDFTILKGPRPSKGSAIPCSVPVSNPLDPPLTRQCYPKTAWGEFVKNERTSSFSKEEMEQIDILGYYNIYEDGKKNIKAFKADGPWSYPVEVDLQKYLSWFSTTSWSMDLNLSITNKLSPRPCRTCTCTPPSTLIYDTFSTCPPSCPETNLYNEVAREEILTASAFNTVNVGSDQGGAAVWRAGAHCKESIAPPLLMGQIDKVKRDQDGKPVATSSNGYPIGKPNYISLWMQTVGSWSREKGCENGDAASGATKVLQFGTLSVLITLNIFNRFFISEDRKTCWPKMALTISFYYIGPPPAPFTPYLNPNFLDTTPDGDPRYPGFTSTNSLAAPIGFFNTDALLHGSSVNFSTPNMTFILDGVNIPIYWNSLMPGILFRSIEDPYTPPSSSDGSLQLEIKPVTYASY